MKRLGKVIIDRRDGFVKVGPIKLFRLRGGVVEVHDKDKKRSRDRGGSTIEVPLDELISALQEEDDD